MDKLRVSYIQTDLYWEDPSRNLQMFADKIAELPETDLIVLPELFSTGFSMRPEIIKEDMLEYSIATIWDIAKRKSCVITGSLIVKENGQYFNRLIWMTPQGLISHYDKRHLFRYGGEHDHYVAGNEKKTVTLKGWNICPLICYDLRFPVWSRNCYSSKGHSSELKPEYDLLIYVANWPERRIHAWKTLLMARAIENQAYVVGVNRVGSDGNDMMHSGDSAVIDYKGELLSKANTGLEIQETIELSKTQLEDFRKSFPAGMDADQFTLKV